MLSEHYSPILHSCLSDGWGVESNGLGPWNRIRGLEASKTCCKIRCMILWSFLMNNRPEQSIETIPSFDQWSLTIKTIETNVQRTPKPLIKSLISMVRVQKTYNGDGSLENHWKLQWSCKNHWNFRWSLHVHSNYQLFPQSEVNLVKWILWNVSCVICRAN